MSPQPTQSHTQAQVTMHPVVSPPRPGPTHVSEAEGPAQEESGKLVEEYFMKVGRNKFSMFLSGPPSDKHR